MSDPALRRLVEVTLDEPEPVARSADAEHEIRIAIFDLVEDNSFAPVGSPGGPYRLNLAIRDGRLQFDIRDAEGRAHGLIVLSLTPLRKTVRDYFAICDSYFAAIKTAAPSQIETIDMARRGLHNEGSELLRERLHGKVEIDFDTARRLFTLICALHHR